MVATVEMQLPKGISIFIILLSIIGIGYSGKTLSNRTLKRKIIGAVEIEETYLKLEGTNLVAIASIEKIIIQHNYIRGEKYAYQELARESSNNGLARLKAITKTGESSTFKFIIDSEEKLTHLKLVFSEWYRQGIEIEEYFTRIKLKTLCFELIQDKSYAEIQEIKKTIYK